MKNKTVIYTAISNNYDDLKEPRVVSPNCDYVCFTDNLKLRSKVWKIRKFPNNSLDYTRTCRKVKILPHLFVNEYKYSIWIDGNISILKDIEPLIKNYKNYLFISLKHPKRNCLYEEANVCINKNKDDKEILIKQIKKYKKNNYPNNNNLTETGIIIRNHNHPLVVKTMDNWWSEIINYSKRDQISFNYVAWKNKLNYSFLDENIRTESGFFYKRDHKKKGYKRFLQLIKDNKHKNIVSKYFFIILKTIKNIYKQNNEK